MVDARLLVMFGLLLVSSVSSRPNQRDLQVAATLSTLEKTLIKSVSVAIPEYQDLNGGGYFLPGVGTDWSIVRSVSDESQLTQHELEMIRRIADAVSREGNGGGGGGDWTIVESIELQPSQFEDTNVLETVPIGGGGGGGGYGGGSVTVPVRDQVPVECPPGYRYYRYQCRKTVPT